MAPLPHQQDDAGDPLASKSLWLFLGISFAIMFLMFWLPIQDALTHLLMGIGGDRLLQQATVPYELHIVSGLLTLLGFHIQTGKQYITWQQALGKNEYIYFTWNCGGWQSLLLFFVSAIPGLSGKKYTRFSRWVTFALGVIGTYLFTLFRLMSVLIVYIWFGRPLGIVFHDYATIFLTLFYLALFWWFAHRFVLKKQTVSLPSLHTLRRSLFGRGSLAGVLIVVLLVNYLAFVPLKNQADAAWYNSGYLYRQAITIDHTKVSGGSDLSNFPVLISMTDTNLKTAANGGYVQNSSGYDIIFTDSTGATKLDHEIEKYVASTGEIDMWVRIPTLSASADTVIYMYYDNSGITTSQENKTGVWDSNYEAVWHLQETGNGTAGEYKDSTSNANNGQGGAGTSSQVPSVVTGEFASAQDFVRSSSQYIKVSDSTSLNITASAMSIEYWAYFASVPSDDSGPVSKGGYSNGYRSLYTSNKKLQFQLTGSSGYNLFSTTLPNTGQWYHVVQTYDGSTMRQYINGTADASTLARTGAVGSSSGVELDIGTGSPTQYFMDGDLQEVRISNTARSAGWIATEYNNQSSPSTFYSVGTAQQNNPTIEQQITIYDGDNPGTGTIGGIVMIDTGNYSGTAAYYFEVDAEVTSGTGTATLTYNAGTGSNPSGGSTVQITGISSTSYARYRSAAFTPTGAQNAYVSADSGTGIAIRAARIVVVQSGTSSIQNTETQIDIGRNENVSSTTDVPINNAKYWKWDSSKYDGTVSVYFEVTMKENTAGQTSYASLYPAGTSCSGQVTGSEVSTDTTTNRLRLRSGNISANLSSGTTYMVCGRSTDSSLSLKNAHLIVVQSASGGITRMELQHVYINTKQQVSTSTYTGFNYLNQYNPADWGGGTFTYYFEATLTTNSSSNAGFADLFDNTASSAITSSAVTTTAGQTDTELQRSGSLTMPSSVDDMDTQLKNASTSTTAVNGSWLIIDVSSLQTPEHALPLLPLMLFLPKIAESLSKRRKRDRTVQNYLAMPAVPIYKAYVESTRRSPAKRDRVGV